MRIYLFAVLLGCFAVSGLAQYNTFEFTDAQGRCWTCSPGTACSPCQKTSGPNNSNRTPLVDPPLTHPRACPAPDCTDPTLRNILWPSPDPRIFIQCTSNGAVWSGSTMDCQCGTFFDYEHQRCEFPWDWVPWCSTLMTPLPPPIPCEDLVTPEPTTIEPETEEPTTIATTVPPPPPCECIPWFPCWCQQNPCWNMPCGRCGGCMG